jgi:hypothetical protein
MKDPRFLLKLNFRIVVFLFALIILIVFPLIVYFDANGAVLTVTGIFCFSVCLMSFWVYEDGKKIEQLTILLNSEKKAKENSS